MANSSIMDTLFQLSLDDLIKGIRLHSPDSSTPISSFLSKSMEEIKKEIKSTDPHTKSTALLKLTYLSSLYGFDMSWAAFNIVEVISFQHFCFKKIGYLAASACFSEATDVLLLATNQFRKDLSSSNEFEVSLALHCFSVIGTPDLCRDLCNDLFTLLSSTRSYVRKKAIAAVLRVFSKYPDGVRVCFRRLVENLENSDPQAVFSAVGVFCELALKDPNACLPLAPEFYRVLVECKNNWVLIKVLKIFGKLAVVEPRLGKKIVEPICELMSRTMAKSLMFECIRTVISSLSDHESAVRVAVLKIKELLVEDDPNLKYLGLQALSDLGSRHLWAVLENKEVVVKSLIDVDPNVRLASLRLVMAMLCEDNVAEIAKVLLNYALKSDPEFCNEILRSILVSCSRNYYEIVFDFDWYVSLLGEMTRVPHCQTGEEIENQLVDIGMRVKDARAELVAVGRDLVIDPALLSNPFLHRILSGAAWVSGEYVEFSKNPFELMEALLQPCTNLLLPSTRAVYIQSALKVLVFCLQTFIFQQNEIDSSSMGFDPEFQLQLPETSNFSTHGAVENFKNDTGSVPRDENGNEVTMEGRSSLSLSGGGSPAHESLGKMLILIENSLEPLSCSHEVEIQDRVRNVLGVVQLVKQYILSASVRHEEISVKNGFEASETTKLITDLFAEELGPVSVNAQAKVCVSNGITLQDNLSELDVIYSDLQLSPSTLFSLGTNNSIDKDADFAFDGQSKEDPESTNSGSLLAQHRQRHGLYYLPSEKDNAGSNEYPPVNEIEVLDSYGHEVNDLVKLGEHSLSIKKKSNHGKPRPVVVKLDEGETFIPTKMLESKDDLLSGAVRDILLGNDEVSMSSQYSAAAGSSSRRSDKEKLVNDCPDSREKHFAAENSEAGKPSSRRNKHKTHNKDKKHRSHGKNDENIEETRHKEKNCSHHRRSRHKAQGKADSNMAVQTQPIPDFLL